MALYVVTHPVYQYTLIYYNMSILLIYYIYYYIYNLPHRMRAYTTIDPGNDLATIERRLGHSNLRIRNAKLYEV